MVVDCHPCAWYTLGLLKGSGSSRSCLTCRLSTSRSFSSGTRSRSTTVTPVLGTLPDCAGLARRSAGGRASDPRPQTGPGVLASDDRSRLKLRLPPEEIAPYIALAGEELDLDGHHLRVGIPSVHASGPRPKPGRSAGHVPARADSRAFEEDVRCELTRHGNRGRRPIRSLDQARLLGPAHPPRAPRQRQARCRLRPAGYRPDGRGIDPVAGSGTWRQEADGVWGVCAPEGGRGTMNPERSVGEESSDMTSPYTRPCGSRGIWRTCSRQRRECSTRPATTSFWHSAWTRSDTGTDCDGASGWRRRSTISGKANDHFQEHDPRRARRAAEPAGLTARMGVDPDPESAEGLAPAGRRSESNSTSPSWSGPYPGITPPSITRAHPGRVRPVRVRRSPFSPAMTIFERFSTGFGSTFGLASPPPNSSTVNATARRRGQRTSRSLQLGEIGPA